MKTTKTTSKTTRTTIKIRKTTRTITITRTKTTFNTVKAKKQSHHMSDCFFAFLIILFFLFEMALRMLANRANQRRCFAFYNMTAIHAYPHTFFILRKNTSVSNVLCKLGKSFFVFFFNLANQFKKCSNFVISFAFCRLGKACIHLGPFVVLATCCIFEIVLGGLKSVLNKTKPKLSMSSFICCRLFKEFGNLAISVFSGLFCIKSLLVSSL